jgi:4-alpha-glucanotransferase
LGITDEANIVSALIRLAWASVADLALTPLQDILDLGSDARMNLPGRPSGNWAWRYRAEQLTDQHLDDVADLTDLYARSTLTKSEK